MVVALLIVLCVARMVWIYNFSQYENNENPCASCASGCKLKRQLDKKQQECKVTKNIQRKLLWIVW